MSATVTACSVRTGMDWPSTYSAPGSVLMRSMEAMRMGTLTCVRSGSV